MALDWNKEISFSGLKKGGTKMKSEYPSKTYMNLSVAKANSRISTRSIPLIVVLVVILGLIIKFGVFDFYDRVNQAQAALEQQRVQLAEMNTAIAGYDELLEEYESYDTEHLAPDASTVSAMSVMEMVQKVVVPHASIESIDLSGNVLTMSVKDINLNSSGALVNLLYQQPLVKSVTVSTASTNGQTAEDVTTTMVVTLQREE